MCVQSACVRANVARVRVRVHVEYCVYPYVLCVRVCAVGLPCARKCPRVCVCMYAYVSCIRACLRVCEPLSLPPTQYPPLAPHAPIMRAQPRTPAHTFRAIRTKNTPASPAHTQDEIFTTGALSLDYVELIESLHENAPSKEDIRERPGVILPCMGLAVHQV